MDSDNPTVASDMASENIFTATNFWTDYSYTTVTRAIFYRNCYRIQSSEAFLCESLKSVSSLELKNEY